MPIPLDHIRLQNFQYFIHAIFRMDIQINGLGEIQAEDSHNGFGIDHIPAGHQIKIVVKFCDIVYK